MKKIILICVLLAFVAVLAWKIYDRLKDRQDNAPGSRASGGEQAGPG